MSKKFEGGDIFLAVAITFASMVFIGATFVAGTRVKAEIPVCTTPIIIIEVLVDEPR